MKRLSFLIYIIVLISYSFSTVEAKEYESVYMMKVEDADKACAEGEWTKAEEAILSAINLEPANPSNPLLLSNLGMIRFNMGMDSLALATLSEAHAKAPASVTILSNRARVLLAMGEEDEAFEDFTLIIDLDSMDVNSRFNRCLLEMRRHDFRAAKADYEFLLSHFPDDISTSIAGASYLSGIGNYREALNCYSKVIKERPEAEYYAGRGYCNLLLDNLQEASDDINSAISLEPDEGEFYLYRAALNKKRYRPDDSDSDARKAISLGVSKKIAAEFLQNVK